MKSDVRPDPRGDEDAAATPPPAGSDARARHGGHVSLEGLHGTVKVPAASAKPWRQYLAFAGPALLVSVGYMDPGNWSTDLQAGAQFKYQLLWIVGLSSLMAIVLQVIAARLGVVKGKDLAQCCRDHLPRWTRWPNWISCEIAIAACDLAEAMGSAVALHLMFPRISLLAALAIFPMLYFVSSRGIMGSFRLGWFLLGTGWLTALFILAMDIYGFNDVWQQGIVVFQSRGN